MSYIRKADRCRTCYGTGEDGDPGDAAGVGAWIGKCASCNGSGLRAVADEVRKRLAVEAELDELKRKPGVVCIWCGEGFCTEGKDLPAIVAWGQAHDRGCERNPLRAEVAALRELLLDMRQHQGSIQPYIKRIDAALAKEAK